MKHTAIFYIADREINKFMGKLDLCHVSKAFVRPTEVSFTTTTPVDEEYFMNIINESKKEEKMWIPAISYMENFFVHKDIKIISDGKQEFFINKD